MFIKVICMYIYILDKHKIYIKFIYLELKVCIQPI